MTKPLDMEALLQKIKELLGEETKPAS